MNTKKGFLVFIPIATLHLVASLTTKNSIAVYMLTLWLNITFAAFRYLNVCPLEIIVRNKPIYWYKIARRMYKRKFKIAILVHVGYILYLLSILTITILT